MKVLLDNKLLWEPSRKVEESEKFLAITNCMKMIDLAEENNGIGLTAVQVGISKAYFVAELKGSFHIVINPKIVNYGKNKLIGKEGCLSFPGMPQGNIERFRKIKVEFTNERDELVTMKLTKLDAIVFQHEYDHTCGVVCVDRYIVGGK